MVNLNNYTIVWRDEFNGAWGSPPNPHWFFFDGWGSGKFRDAYYTNKLAFHDGNGHLVLRSQIQDGKFKTSFLQTYSWYAPQSEWTTFGPGEGKYIEARVRFSELHAHGPWVAFWLFDPSDTYDGNPANGTEIDIMEYVLSDGLMNSFNVANHWGPLGSWGHEGKMINAGAHGFNLRQGWHTFGLEWTKNELVYYINGKEVWSTTNGVATGNGQALLLSVEYDQGPGDAWGINENVYNDASKLPDRFLVDYVRVYSKKPALTSAGPTGHETGTPPDGGIGIQVADTADAALAASQSVIAMAVAVLVGALVLRRTLRRASAAAPRLDAA